MAEAQFQHLRLSMVKDVAVVEILTRDIQGAQSVQELDRELAAVLAQDWARKVLLNFGRVAYLGSTGFAAIFRLLRRARAEGREVKLCGMEHALKLGAEIVNLPQVVEIHDDESSALQAFANR